MLERLTLVNRSAFPAPWVELIDRSSVPIVQRSRAFAIGRNTSLRWHERIVCRQRGKFVLGPTTLRTGDPFGLFDVEINLAQTASLLVLPPVIAWSSLPVLSRGRDEEGRTNSRPSRIGRCGGTGPAVCPGRQSAAYSLADLGQVR